MKTQRALRLTLLTTCTAVVASLIAAPSMAELNQECLLPARSFKNRPTPHCKFGSLHDDVENARCRAKCRGARSKVQFKADEKSSLCQRAQSCTGIRSSKMATQPGSCSPRRRLYNLAP